MDSISESTQHELQISKADILEWPLDQSNNQSSIFDEPYFNKGGEFQMMSIDINQRQPAECSLDKSWLDISEEEADKQNYSKILSSNLNSNISDAFLFKKSKVSQRPIQPRDSLWSKVQLLTEQMANSDSQMAKQKQEQYLGSFVLQNSLMTENRIKEQPKIEQYLNTDNIINLISSLLPSLGIFSPNMFINNRMNYFLNKVKDLSLQFLRNKKEEELQQNMEREELVNPFEVSNENNKNNFNEPLQLVITLLSKNNYKSFEILPSNATPSAQHITKIQKFNKATVNNINIYNMTVSLPNPRNEYILKSSFPKFLNIVEKEPIEQTITIDKSKVINNHYLLFKEGKELHRGDVQLYQKQMIKVHISSLFYCLQFIVKITNIEQGNIFVYLKYLVDQFTHKNLLKNIEEIIECLNFLKINSYAENKYCIYFMCSIFRNNFFQYYFAGNLYNSLKFNTNYLFDEPVDTPSLRIFEEWYCICNLINILTKQSTKVSMRQISLVLKNVAPKLKLLALQIIAGGSRIQLFEEQSLSHQIHRQFLTNQHLTAIQYYDIYTSWILHQIQSNKVDEEQCICRIMYFIDFLIKLVKIKGFTNRHQLIVQNQVSEKILSKIVGQQKHPKRILLFISKVKELYNLSEGRIQFLANSSLNLNFLNHHEQIVPFLSIIFSQKLTYWDEKIVTQIFSDPNFSDQTLQQVITSFKKQTKFTWVQKYKRLFSIFIKKCDFSSRGTCAQIVLGQFNELVKDEKNRIDSYELLKNIVDEIMVEEKKRDQLYWYGSLIINIILQRFYKDSKDLKNLEADLYPQQRNIEQQIENKCKGSVLWIIQKFKSQK